MPSRPSRRTLLASVLPRGHFRGGGAGSQGPHGVPAGRTIPRMVILELILREGYGDPEGNRLLDRLEEQTGLVGDPLPRDHSRLYHVAEETFEDGEAFIRRVFEEQLREPHWHERLRFGVEGGADTDALGERASVGASVSDLASTRIAPHRALATPSTGLFDAMRRARAMGRTGLEPVTSGLSSRRSPS